MPETYSDDYRELIEKAEEALEELLRASSPDSWIRLRLSYGELCSALELDDAKREKAESETEQVGSNAVRDVERMREREQDEQQRLACRELERFWRRMPVEQREAYVLQALASERLPMSDLLERLNAALDPHGTSMYRTVGEPKLRPVIVHMLETGQIDRAKAPVGRRLVFHYFRKRGLSGPIAEIDRAMREEA